MLTVAGQRRTCNRSHRLRLSILLDFMLSLDLPEIKAPRLSIQFLSLFYASQSKASIFFGSLGIAVVDTRILGCVRMHATQNTD